MIRDFHRPDGQDGWVFSVARDGTVVDAGIGHYMGWKLDELENEIQKALSTPSTPDLILRP